MYQISLYRISYLLELLSKIILQIWRPQASNFAISRCAIPNRGHQTRKSSGGETRKPYQTKGQTPFTLLNVSTFLFIIMLIKHSSEKWCVNRFSIMLHETHLLKLISTTMPSKVGLILCQYTEKYNVILCICLDEQVRGLEATEFPDAFAKISCKCEGKSSHKVVQILLSFSAHYQWWWELRGIWTCTAIRSCFVWFHLSKMTMHRLSFWEFMWWLQSLILYMISYNIHKHCSRKKNVWCLSLPRMTSYKCQAEFFSHTKLLYYVTLLVYHESNLLNSK